MRKRKLLLLTTISTGLVLTLFLSIAQNKAGGSGQKQDKIVTDTTTDEEGELTNDDPWTETQKLVHAYYNSTGTFYRGTMKLIDENSDDEKIIEQNAFECTLLDDNYQYRLGGIEVINKSGLILFADHDNKSIAVSPKAANSKNRGFMFNIDEFKKLMEASKASARVSQSGNMKMLSIDNINDPTIQGYRIYYDPASYKISRILIGMLRLSSLEEEANTGQDNSSSVGNKQSSGGDEDDDQMEVETYTYYLEINYAEIKAVNIKEETFHPESKFIRIAKGKIELMPAYSSYELLDNTESSNETTSRSEEN